MTTEMKKIISMIDALPLAEQNAIFEIVREYFLKWDPDFSKLTRDEAADIKAANQQIASGEVASDNEVDWNGVK